MVSTARPEELARLEALALDLYSPASTPTARTSARLRLTPVALSPNSLSQCHLLLQRSSSPEALLFACNALLELISSYFNMLSSSDTLALHQSIMALLQSSTSRPLFVQSSAIRLLCRLTKLSWLEHNDHRKIFETTIGPILSSQTQLGLQMLDELLVEFFTNTSTLSLIDNRRIAANFRVSCLHEIACISAELIANVNVRTLAIRVLCRALTANSTVSLPEEALDDGASLMLSDKWAETVANARVIEKFADLSVEAPEVIEVLATMARIRRSLWAGSAREEWVKAMMHATQTIARRSGPALIVDETQTLFAQWLMNLKMTFQLTDFIAVSDAQQWFSDIGDITVLIWGASANENSMLSFLKFWSGVAKARRNPPSCAAEYEADRQISCLALRFLELQCEAHYRTDRDDQKIVEEELDCYAVIFHHACSVTLAAFHNQFDKALQNQAVHCLSWLVALSISIVTQQRTIVSGEARGRVDASITFRILQLLDQPSLYKARLIQLHIIFFLDEIRQSYFIDGSRIFSTNQQAANNIFYAHLTELCSRAMTMEVLVTLLLPALGRMLSLFGISSVAEDQLVAEEAAELIMEITAGPTGQNVLKHTNLADMLVALTEKTTSMPLRTKLASCLSHFLISNGSESDDDDDYITSSCLRLFGGRLTELLSTIAAHNLTRFSESDLIALVCDLNGMAHAVQSHSKFSPFWCFLEPYMSIFANIMSNQSSMTFRKAMLDLIRTMTNHNTADPFGPVSSAGLRLFKSLAQVLEWFAESFIQGSEAGGGFSTSFGTQSPREAGSPVPSPRIMVRNNEDTIDCLEIYFDIVAGILSGSWVQTGVMKLYGDMTACRLISRALAVIIKGVVPLNDLLSIAGTKRAVVQLLTILCEFYVEHLAAELSLEERYHLVMAMMLLCLERKEYIAVDCLSALISAPSILSDNLASQVFEVLLDSTLFESVDIAKLSIPLFPLIIGQPSDCLSSYKAKILESNPSNRAAVIECFDELTRGLYRKMSPTKPHISVFTHNIGRARAILSKAGIYSSVGIKIN